MRKKDLCPKVIQTTTQHFSLLENPSVSAKNPLKIFSGISKNKQETLSVKIQENDVVYPFPIFNQKTTKKVLENNKNVWKISKFLLQIPNINTDKRFPKKPIWTLWKTLALPEQKTNICRVLSPFFQPKSTLLPFRCFGRQNRIKNVPNGRRVPKNVNKVRCEEKTAEGTGWNGSFFWTKNNKW